MRSFHFSAFESSRLYHTIIAEPGADAGELTTQGMDASADVRKGGGADKQRGAQKIRLNLALKNFDKMNLDALLKDLGNVQQRVKAPLSPLEVSEDASFSRQFVVLDKENQQVFILCVRACVCVCVRMIKCVCVMIMCVCDVCVYVYICILFLI